MRGPVEALRHGTVPNTDRCSPPAAQAAIESSTRTSGHLTFPTISASGWQGCAGLAARLSAFASRAHQQMWHYQYGIHFWDWRTGNWHWKSKSWMSSCSCERIRDEGRSFQRGGCPRQPAKPHRLAREGLARHPLPRTMHAVLAGDRDWWSRLESRWGTDVTASKNHR